ncbi:inovirus-type Gp2 protein [Acidithiobacillus sp.]|uniref:YagK/YfjJ domain-containing protein n=1 Tax=Acidithiobacillus sp. TaxID=1872118 RepID=UPI0025BDF0F2|nr:inovirus-type Gp2 protein [Acidithiobacillus sp.]
MNHNFKIYDQMQLRDILSKIHVTDSYKFLRESLGSQHSHNRQSRLVKCSQESSSNPDEDNSDQLTQEDSFTLDDWDRMYLLEQIERYVTLLELSHQSPVEKTRNRRGDLEMHLDKHICPNCYHLHLSALFLTMDYLYSPKVQAFLDALTKDERIHELKCMTNQEQGRLINSVAESVRRILKSPAYRKTVQRRHHNYLRQFYSAMGFVDDLFRQHSRILVVRFDLAFRYDLGEMVGLDESKRYFTAFIEAIRGSRKFRDRYGYLAKLEYGHDKGFHFHIFMFFDGSKRRADSHIAEEAGKIWMRITEGRGIYFNCNRKKVHYKYLGIGQIHRRDTEKLGHLASAIGYLVKLDQFLLYKTRTRLRTFMRSGITTKETVDA